MDKTNQINTSIRLNTMQNQRHHTHAQAGPPRSYSDLSHADIDLLTNILSHAPRSPAQNHGYEGITANLISALPSHLKNKMSWLAPACSLHSRINPHPVISMFEAIKHEIDDGLPHSWEPIQAHGLLTEAQVQSLMKLQDLSALWLKPDAFESNFRRKQVTQPPYRYQADKCAACILSHIGGDLDACMALGAFFIGRTSTNIWKKSKRVLWMEAWIRQAVADGSQDAAVRRVWEMGVELRQQRENFKSKHGERAYVDEFIDRARGSRQPAGAPTLGEAFEEMSMQDMPPEQMPEFFDQAFAEDQPVVSSRAPSVRKPSTCSLTIRGQRQSGRASALEASGRTSAYSNRPMSSRTASRASTQMMTPPSSSSAQSRHITPSVFNPSQCVPENGSTRSGPKTPSASRSASSAPVQGRVIRPVPSSVYSRSINATESNLFQGRPISGSRRSSALDVSGRISAQSNRPSAARAPSSASAQGRTIHHAASYARSINADGSNPFQDRPVSGDGWSIRSSRLNTTESDLIDLYNHSTAEISPFIDNAVPDPLRVSKASRQSSKQKDPELARYPRHRMPPVGIPSSTPDDAYSQASEIRRRETVRNTPRLRVGRNGQVKGPMDPASMDSLRK